MDEIEQRLTQLRDMAGKYSKAQSQRVYLEEFKKSKLALLQKRYMHEYPTVSAQEREARADREYIELLDGLRVATEEAERLRWELRIAEMGAGLWQTKQANQRVERRGYGA